MVPASPIRPQTAAAPCSRPGFTAPGRRSLLSVTAHERQGAERQFGENDLCRLVSLATGPEDCCKSVVE